MEFNFRRSLEWWEPNPGLELLNQKLWKRYGKTIQCNFENALSNRLKESFNGHGSDKASNHNYHLIYALIFEMLEDLTSILEIGIGSQNPQIDSSMQDTFKPGGSLRAWSKMFPQAKIYGADIDETIFINEGLVSSHYVNQLDTNSVENLARIVNLDLGGDIDLIIDDGLHAPSASINSLDGLFSLLSSRGVYVVEDIRPNFRGIWCGAIAAGITPGYGQVFLLKGEEISEDSCVAVFCHQMLYIDTLMKFSI
jgi:hypothetical protein